MLSWVALVVLVSCAAETLSWLLEWTTLLTISRSLPTIWLKAWESTPNSPALRASSWVASSPSATRLASAERRSRAPLTLRRMATMPMTAITISSSTMTLTAVM
ncbi:hypothetical protein D9M71_838760 [compost metagenome]